MYPAKPEGSLSNFLGLGLTGKGEGLTDGDGE